MSDFWIVFIVTCVVFYLYDRYKAAVLQIEKEEYIREAVRYHSRRQKIDELYGREKK